MGCPLESPFVHGRLLPRKWACGQRRPTICCGAPEVVNLPALNRVPVLLERGKRNHVQTEQHHRVSQNHLRMYQNHLRVSQNHIRVSQNHLRASQNHLRDSQNHLRVKSEPAQVQGVHPSMHSFLHINIHTSTYTLDVSLRGKPLMR